RVAHSLGQQRFCNEQFSRARNPYGSAGPGGERHSRGAAICENRKQSEADPQRAMNDLKFAVRQLLKNPGFTAVAVLTLARRRPLLSPKNAPHLPVINTHLDDEIPATAPDVVARTIANPPANPVGAGMFRGREQTLLEFDAFSSSAVIGGGNRPGERHSQFVLQNGFIQSLRHDAFRSGLRQYSLGLAKFNDVTGWRDKVKER